MNLQTNTIKQKQQERKTEKARKPSHRFISQSAIMTTHTDIFTYNQLLFFKFGTFLFFQSTYMVMVFGVGLVAVCSVTAG